VPTPAPLDTPEDERSLQRYLLVGLVFMAVLIAAFPFYRAGEPERRAEAREAMHRHDVELGRRLYGLHCAACHGEGARGGRGSATLAAEEFLGSVSDEQMRWLIAVGIPGTAMPAYELDHGGPLTRQDIDQVVAFLRSLEETAPSVPDWRRGAPAPPPAADSGRPRTAESSGAGKQAPEADAPPAEAAPPEGPAELFAQHCASCHGPSGAGTTIAGAVRPPAPPLDADREALVEAIAKGVPGTAMPAYAKAEGGPLEPASIEALARWLQATDSTPGSPAAGGGATQAPPPPARPEAPGGPQPRS